MGVRVTNTKLKPYMIFSRTAGPMEGAFLAFAHTEREARKIAGQCFLEIVDSYIDIGARLMRNKPWLFDDANAEKLANNVPHLIDNPASCHSCFMWGASEIIGGLCADCAAEPVSYYELRDGGT